MMKEIALRDILSKQQAVCLWWYTNGYKDFLYSRKHCVIYNQKLYATELLEDDTF